MQLPSLIVASYYFQKLLFQELRDFLYFDPSDLICANVDDSPSFVATDAVETSTVNLTGNWPDLRWSVVGPRCWVLLTSLPRSLKSRNPVVAAESTWGPWLWRMFHVKADNQKMGKQVFCWCKSVQSCARRVVFLWWCFCSGGVFVCCGLFLW